jgi:alkylated DNA nucleotide flippase Atl1
MAARSTAAGTHQLRTSRILDAVRAIPRGCVASYRDIDATAPRLVGRILATTHEQVPWHRVIRSDGTIPMGDAQRERLRCEGVPLRGDRVDLREARFVTDPGDLNQRVLRNIG